MRVVEDPRIDTIYVLPTNGKLSAPWLLPHSGNSATSCRATTPTGIEWSSEIGRFRCQLRRGLALRHPPDYWLRTPAMFEFGIGAHCGTAVVGEFAFGDSRVFTALGEVVHLSARLEQASKTLRQTAVISGDVFRHANRIAPEGSAREITPRGHDRPLAVHLLSAVELRAGLG